LVGLVSRQPTHSEGEPRDQDEGGEGGHEPTPPTSGQMELTPANCRKVVTACIQSVATFGVELWWNGEATQGAIGRANDVQLLVNQEARAVTDCFQTTNLGALAMQSGLGPAVARLENRQRWFGLRLLRLPQGDQAREVVGAALERGCSVRLCTRTGWSVCFGTQVGWTPQPYWRSRRR
jgi:hypothetical protein